jgi:hypothetical protein
MLDPLIILAALACGIASRAMGLPAVVRFTEEAEELAAMGISTFNLYAQTGAGFAAHTAEQLQSAPPSIGK